MKGLAPLLQGTESQRLAPLARTREDPGHQRKGRDGHIPKADVQSGACLRAEKAECKTNARDEESQDFLHRGDPWMCEQPGGAGVAPVLDEVIRKPLDLVDMVQKAASEGASTDVARESSMVTPRESPAPDSPPL